MNEKGNIRLSSLDWLIMKLYQDVKDEIITPIVNRIKNSLLSEDKNALILKWNLISSFANIIELLDSKIAFEKEEKMFINKFLSNIYTSRNKNPYESYCDIDTSTIIRLIDEKYYLLFNSYFYKISNVFGSKYLYPIILGNNYINGNKEHYSILYEILNERKIPFRIYGFEEFYKSYKSQLLPLTGGITPKVTSKGFNCQSIKTTKINNFLSHPSLLHKREDFVQAHFSALIRPIRDTPSFTNNSNPIYTLVFTSLVPNIFIEEDGEILDKLILKYESLGAFSAFNLDFSLKDSSVKTAVMSGNGKISSQIDLDEIEKCIIPIYENDSLNDIISIQAKFQNILDNKEELVRIVSLNTKILDSITPKLFPTGPWLEPQIVKNGNKEIDFDKFEDYCNSLNNFFNNNYKPGTNNQVFDKFINLIFPTIKSKNNVLENEFLKVKIKNTEYSVLYFIDKLNQEKFKDELSNLTALISELILNGDETLEGENIYLIDLQKELNKYLLDGGLNGFNYKNNSLNISIELTYEFVSTLRGFFITSIYYIYLPKETKSNIVDIHSNGAFWTIQNIFNLLFQRKIKLNDFQNYKSKSPKFLYKKNNISDINVELYLSKKPSRNKKIERALLYFGIFPILITYNDENFFKIRLLDSNNNLISEYLDFNLFYIDYVKNTLQNKMFLNELNLIFNQSVEKLEIKYENEQFFILLYGKTTDKLTFKQLPTIKLESFFLNFNRIFDEYLLLDKKLKSNCSCNNKIECSINCDRWNFDTNINFILKGNLCQIANKANDVYLREKSLIDLKEKNSYLQILKEIHTLYVHSFGRYSTEIKNLVEHLNENESLENKKKSSLGLITISKELKNIKDKLLERFSEINLQSIFINQSLNTIIENFAKENRNIHGYNIFNNTFKTYRIYFDRLIFEEIIKSLINNAVKALAETEKEGLVLLKTRKVQGSPTERRRKSDLSDFVVIDILDNGCGFSEKPNELWRTFGTSKWNKKENIGTGQGLYIVYNLMHSFGGDIEVKSKTLNHDLDIENKDNLKYVSQVSLYFKVD